MSIWRARQGDAEPVVRGFALVWVRNLAAMHFSTSAPATWFSGILGPLAAKFGSDVTVSRAGNMVCWGYEGRSVVIEITADGSLRATFIDSESIDAVSASPAAAAYRTGSSYALNRVSCGHMVADLVDFFSGVREPKFQFVDAYPR